MIIIGNWRTMLLCLPLKIWARFNQYWGRLGLSFPGCFSQALSALTLLVLRYPLGPKATKFTWWNWKSAPCGMWHMSKVVKMPFFGCRGDSNQILSKKGWYFHLSSIFFSREATLELALSVRLSVCSFVRPWHYFIFLITQLSQQSTFSQSNIASRLS